MNHFFALRLSEEARDTVHQTATAWQPKVMRSSWYDPEDYHITLKFLGNLDEAEQPRLIKAAKPIAEETSPLTTRAASFGGFPDMQAPSVLWAGIEITPELDRLATLLDRAMAEIGFRPDRRRCQPHITVARCRLRTSCGSNWPLPDERLFLPFVASEFILMQTRSGEGSANRTGLRYNSVHTFPLAGAQVSDVS